MLSAGELPIMQWIEDFIYKSGLISHNEPVPPPPSRYANQVKLSKMLNCTKWAIKLGKDL